MANEERVKINNEIAEKTSALESKIFELIKQESPDDYSAEFVKRALQITQLKTNGIIPCR
jgi:hypothetical protein